MDALTSKDGTQIYYKDWGRGPPVVFSHCWPLNSDFWDGQLHFLVQHGFRVVAHDRRGHGRSEQATSGNDIATYMDDLAAVIDTLDLRNVSLVGHSTGCAEIIRYIARHAKQRAIKATLIGPTPPLMVKTPANPGGVPMETLNLIRSNLSQDRSQFYRNLAVVFYGASRLGSKVSQGMLDQFWLWSMQSGLRNAHEAVKAFSETDSTQDWMKLTLPTLVIHGQGAQMFYANTARISADLIPGATQISYRHAPDGLNITHQDQLNADLLAFLRA